MPGNTVEIQKPETVNRVSINKTWKEFYVGDSKMPELLEWLEKNGIPLEDKHIHGYGD